jgi:hypothetical protein
MIAMGTTSTSTDGATESEPGLRLAARSGLDMMLNDTELEDGGVRRFLKPRAAARTVAGLARHPRRTARDAGGLGLELARVSAGRSDDTLRFRQGQWLSPVLRDWCDAGAESRKTDDDGSPCARGCCARVLASRYGERSSCSGGQDAVTYM